MIKCRHCGHTFHATWDEIYVGRETTDRERDWSDDARRTWILRKVKCPNCTRLTLFVRELKGYIEAGDADLREASKILGDRMVQPEDTGREPKVNGVPAGLAEDYQEACRVIKVSAKASAALSRRCLQHFLREHMSVKPGNLADEIQEVLNRKVLPSHLADAIDAVRHVGNFAAHPIKSKNTGEIIDVEPGEAEWLLETLEGLFDLFFVQPEELKRKKAALEAKLKEAGKAPMK